jgi:diadenosine tetraphosphate (Ap4A) HIT family hydrolase/cytidylate kinase
VSCSLCRHERDALLVEADSDAAILIDRSPMCVGHLLVVSPTHVPAVDDMPTPARERFMGKVEAAKRVASALGNSAAIAIEHGRSPTCGDRSCSCHAHVHVLPVGDMDEETLLEADFIEAREEPGADSYLAIAGPSGDWRHYALLRPIPHAARTVASLIATANGVRWRPLVAFADGTADAALTETRTRLRLMSGMPKGSVDKRSSGRRRHSGRSKPLVIVSGSTGSGKTTVGAHLARYLEVPAIELGVILRLASLKHEHEGRAANRLWRWNKKGRLDFDGPSQHRLAASVPRLDGGSHELPMWTEVEAVRLATLARQGDVQEILAAIAERAARETGAVIVGRVPPGLNGDSPSKVVALGATPQERSRRKRLQLARIGMSADEHDWFDPRATSRPALEGGIIDTTTMSIEAMCAAALSTAINGSRRHARAS